jgi:hypothetical protein
MSAIQFLRRDIAKTRFITTFYSPSILSHIPFGHRAPSPELSLALGTGVFADLSVVAAEAMAAAPPPDVDELESLGPRLAKAATN